MFEIFSTREVATAFYILIIFIYICTNKRASSSLITVIKTACTPKLVIPFIVLIMYAAVLIYGFTYLPFWKKIYIKDIAIWIIFAGVPVSFNAVSKGNTEHYFIDILKDNFKVAVLLEFFIGTFTFDFLIELLIQPILAFFILVQAVSRLKEEYKKVKVLLDWLVAIMGFIIIGFTIKAAYGSYKEINPIDTVIGFCIPIVFSLAYIPIAYIFALWAKYEMVFMRMNFKEPKDKKITRKHRIVTLWTCKFSLKKVYLFQNECVNNMYVGMKEKDFEKMIKDFKCKRH